MSGFWFFCSVVVVLAVATHPQKTGGLTPTEALIAHWTDHVRCDDPQSRDGE